MSIPEHTARTNTNCPQFCETVFDMVTNVIFDACVCVNNKARNMQAPVQRAHIVT